MKLFLAASLVMLASVFATQAQQVNRLKSYFNSFIQDTADISRPQVLVYPTLGYSPETNTEIGLSGLLLYYHGRDTTNRLSEITARTFFTFENQYGAFLEHALYTDNNDWFMLGNIRYQSFPVSFYGVGISTTLSDEQTVSGQQLLIRERILRKIRGNFYAGVNLDYNLTSGVNFSNPRLLPESPRLHGKDGSQNLGLGLGLVLDTRHNVLNVRNGYFIELALVNSAAALISDHDFRYINIDTRYFETVRKNQVLAMQLVGQFSWGEVPFNQLPQIGGPFLMRGYYQGRFRDRHLLATQMEYRFLPLPLGFTDRIGAVAFASAGTVYSDISSVDFRHLKGAAGAGLRFLLFPKKDIYIRLDYALTREGNGFYIYIGEAF
ncbi:BamA/TamA family outer membrane protein [Lunatimonas salinarum]|uniref:BamA/TamA family outer membrane protein n=1 Tax=Lunatimonas salinarum TaxID=1774590 RepID=UPI001AE01C82|nr:BamA/TamA family outer membrane protein [Lunatimonas salinarum]